MLRLILSLLLEISQLYEWSKGQLQPAVPFSPNAPSTNQKRDTILWLNELCDMCFDLLRKQEDMYQVLLRDIFITIGTGGVIMIIWIFYSDAILDFSAEIYNKYFRK